MNSNFSRLAQATAMNLLWTSANEGMWMPAQITELGAAMRANGLQLDPAQLSRLDTAPLNAIVSLGGCSASFVSPQGLVRPTVTACWNRSSTTARRVKTISPRDF
ncbi:S46 family peptidase [Mesorhizobium sp.]|uniref:S46 family peptidase n=1 Tax=Mesorhizobium sp. TaxID=1871066 RepID=UPI00338FB424